MKYDPDDSMLATVRAHAFTFANVSESEIYGRPWFSAPHGFAVYGGATSGPNRKSHPQSVLVRIEPSDLPARLSDPRFYVPAYFASRGWLGIDLTDESDWTELDELLTDSYDLAHNRPHRPG